jgi:hypothetical protein
MDIAVIVGLILLFLLAAFLYNDGTANLADYCALRTHRWAVARRRHQRDRAAELNRQWKHVKESEASPAPAVEITRKRRFLFTKSGQL